MGIFSKISELCFGVPTAGGGDPAIVFDPRTATTAVPTVALRRRRQRVSRRCTIETLEPRQMMAGDVAPEVVLGSVYFEEATGDDSAGDILEVSYVGGAAGTTLSRLVINGDKQQNGFSEGDLFFDTEAGGLGAFHYNGLSITSAEGFVVTSATVVDGGSQIVFTFSGFDAGEKLVFSIDADEAQFIEAGAVADGTIDPTKVDVNPLVEGAEFQRSTIRGDFTAPGYVDLSLTATYWDAYDDEFLAAQSAAGQIPDLHGDVYSDSHDYSDRTAGAIAHAPQIPLATLAGWVYHDRSDDGAFDTASEQGIGGVTLELLDENGSPTGITTTTSNEPGKVGFYEFRDLTPGKYGVREVQPSGWLDGKDTAGSHGGSADSETGGRVDRIFGAILAYGDDAVNYNFGELLPGSIHGRVIAGTGPDCKFDDPEILVEGVRIDLLDANGNEIAHTFTDAQGEYAFTGLVPGIYTVREHQPTQYYDGGERVGTAGGTTSDVPGVFSITTGINIASGLDAYQYDFCEKVGVMLSGNVYHDRDDDGNFDRDTEQGIAGVVVKLLDEQGSDTGLRATTDANGFYKFNNLAAGKYAVMEVHPSGWLDGKDTPGNLGGTADTATGGDMLSQIMINWGQMGTEYNFGELLPGSIRGQVFLCTDSEEADDPPIPNVRIDLLGASGNVIAHTFTDANGEYEFTGLRPGTYSVREHQPIEYFDNKAHLGSGGGSILSSNLMTDIAVGSDIHLVEYDFCESPPSQLSGYVYIDGEPIVTNETLTPAEILAMRDGIHTPDDRPLANVVLELRDGATGLPISKDLALLGSYDGDQSEPIRVTTDANGYYQFVGLKAGTYAVVQLQPEGVIDHVETAGTTGGYPVNRRLEPVGREVEHAGAAPTLDQQEVIDRFEIEFGNNAIVMIPLTAGAHSQHNNFSEVTTEPKRIPWFDPKPLPEPKPQVFAGPGVPFHPKLVLANPLPPYRLPNGFGGSGAIGFTWHLSVVNAGLPRSVVNNATFQLTAGNIGIWNEMPMDQGQWTLAVVDYNEPEIVRNEAFGHPEGKPIVGDFNGDGVSDIGIFVNGRWFLDVNGNGRWDDADLWAKLGNGEDLPVTGDWDADGKDDIGIYGPAWERDPIAVEYEPGLPDSDNFPTQPVGKMKNMPPTAEEATSGGRVMKLTSRAKLRADLIDHVFHYGNAGDAPVSGDWNGDGVRQIGVFSGGVWVLDLDGDGRFTERDATVKFGQAGDVPVVGDFNGDGIDDLGVFRAGKWVLDINGDRELDAHDKAFELGGVGDVPVVGDWNDDGVDDPGIYRAGKMADRVSRKAG